MNLGTPPSNEVLIKQPSCTISNNLHAIITKIDLLNYIRGIQFMKVSINYWPSSVIPNKWVKFHEIKITKSF